MDLKDIYLLDFILFIGNREEYCGIVVNNEILTFLPKGKLFLWQSQRKGWKLSEIHEDIIKNNDKRVIRLTLLRNPWYCTYEEYKLSLPRKFRNLWNRRKIHNYLRPWIEMLTFGLIKGEQDTSPYNLDIAMDALEILGYPVNRQNFTSDNIKFWCHKPNILN